jgi:hypothetical protein
MRKPDTLAVMKVRRTVANAALSAASGLALTIALANWAVAQSPTGQGQREDVAVFRREVFEPSAAYSPPARVEAARRLGKLEREAGHLSDAAFTVAICQITALADNLHSSCFFSRKTGAPLGFTDLGGRFFVTLADPPDADLLGGELISVDGRGVSALKKAGRSLTGGPDVHRDLTFATLLNRIDLLNALGLTDKPEIARYRIRLVRGAIVERSLTPKAREADWPRLPSADRTPWALQDPATIYRWRDAADLDAVVIQLRGNVDTAKQKLLDFLNEAEANRKRLGRANVVLDMRWDTGGNFLLNRDFMRAWPSALPAQGRFFVLMGPANVSAGMASVAYLKQAGGDRVVIVGEPPGDRLMFFSEGDFKDLPHAGVMLLPSTQRYDFRTGCRGYRDCFVSIAQPGSPTGTPPDEAATFEAYGRAPLEVQSLDPQVAAPWTIGDYLDGEDPGMRAIASLIQRSR